MSFLPALQTLQDTLFVSLAVCLQQPCAWEQEEGHSMHLSDKDVDPTIFVWHQLGVFCLAAWYYLLGNSCLAMLCGTVDVPPFPGSG